MRKVTCGTTVLLAVVLLLGMSAGPSGAEGPQIEHDLGGATVRIVAGQAPTYEDHVALPYTFLPIVPAAADSYLEWIEEQFHVSIEWEGKSVGETQYGISDWLAPEIMAGEAPDLIKAWSIGHIMAKSEGFLMPLERELLVRDVPEVKSRPLDSYSMFAGQHYTFAHDWPRSGTGVVWNKSLFEREGLPSLYDVYEAGEWTWEAMREFAIQATRDTTGDGEIDQYGLSEWGNNYTVRFPVWFLGSNAIGIFRVEDDQPVFVLDEPKGIEAYEFLQALFQEDDVIGTHAGFWNDQKVAMHTHNPDTFRHVNPLDFWDDEAGFVPFPMGPDAEEHRAPFTHVTSWGIPVTTRHDPGALVELVFALNAYTNNFMGVPGFFQTSMETRIAEDIENFGLYVFDQQSLEHYRFVCDNMVIYNQYETAFFPMYQELNQRILLEGEDVSRVIAEIKPTAQVHLDDVFAY